MTWRFDTDLRTIDQATRWLDRHLPVTPDKASGLVNPVPFEMATLYPKQKAIIDDPARFTMCEATTKAGKTMSHIEWLLDEAASKGYGEFWWVATVYTQAHMAFERAKRRLDGYLMFKGKYIKVMDPVPYTAKDSKRQIFLGGAKITFKSADNPDTLYGEDVQAAVGDEVSRWKEAAWVALFTTLTSTMGKAKLIGNVKGRNNWAYKAARKAETKEDPEWGYHKLTAIDAVEGGVMDQQAVDQAKKTMKPEDFLELYMAEASADGGNPFGVQQIEDMMEDEPSDQPTVAFGVDLGDKVDWTWIIGLDEAGHQTISVRFKGMGWEAQIPRIQKVVGNLPAFIDETGIGEGLFLMIKKKCKKAEPFKFTPGPNGSRQRLLRDLELDIDKQGLKIYDDRIKAQLLLCERRYNTRGDLTYGLDEGEHDDGMMALGLAAKCLRDRPIFEGGIRSLKDDG